MGGIMVKRFDEPDEVVCLHGIAAIAGPGEVLASASTVARLEGSGLSFAAAGDHELKGLAGLRQVYRLTGDVLRSGGLVSEVAPPRE